MTKKLALPIAHVVIRTSPTVSVKYTLRADGGAQEAFRSDEVRGSLPLPLSLTLVRRR